MRFVSPSVKLLHSTPDPELIIERAGRVCYKSESRITETSHVAFIRNLIARGHESVLEHASAGFLITADRGITHELVRHRLASFSQASTRYCRFKDEIEVVKPSTLDEGGAAYDAWETSCLRAETCYNTMLSFGEKPEIARSVLPTCLASEICMTANFREWRHFLSLRLAPAAHPDMRVVAGLVRDELMKLAPNVFV